MSLQDFFLRFLPFADTEAEKAWKGYDATVTKSSFNCIPKMNNPRQQHNEEEADRDDEDDSEESEDDADADDSKGSGIGAAADATRDSIRESDLYEPFVSVQRVRVPGC